MAFVALVAFASCKESNGVEDEFADWQSRNDSYFASVLANARTRIAQGDTSWKVIRQWSIPEETGNFHPAETDYIVVHVLESGKSVSGSPLFSDTVRVHYRGRLMPSANYPTGLIFDSSYSGDLNTSVAVPAKMGVGSVVDGFATALQHMVIGDRWEVYIPYQLGYGSTASSSSSIPAYSTLVFDVKLHSFYRAGASIPAFNAKKGYWVEE